MTEPTRIFHNPRCSKSRQALALLQERGIEPEIIRYLDSPPSIAELTAILKQLECSPRELLRTGESVYRELELADPEIRDRRLIEVMTENPVLIERPIVIHKGRARLGRPPEQVLELF